MCGLLLLLLLLLLLQPLLLLLLLLFLLLLLLWLLLMLPSKGCRWFCFHTVLLPRLNLQPLPVDPQADF